MTDKDLQLKAIDTLVQMHNAINNEQKDESANSTIKNSIEILYLRLLDILRQDAPLFFEELEKKSLLNLGIKSININKEELRISINLPTDKQQTAHDEGVSHELIEETVQMESDDKVILTMEKDQETVSNLKITEGEISENIAEMEQVFTRINAMHGSIESLPSQQKKDMIKELSSKVADWIEMEETVTPVYKTICTRLQALIQDFFIYGYYVEASHIIDAFSKINNGTLEKNDEMRWASLDILRNLASDSNVNILFKEIAINEKKGTTGANYILYRILAAFGDIILVRILDRLLATSDGKERMHILHVIEEMGQRAIPRINERITDDTPWYFLRNMAYILGRIGNETSIDVLRPLLLHKDKRVHKEAFKSIGQVGGNKRGRLYLSVLSQADKELKINIIEFLGKNKCTEAVPNLLDMLTNKSSLAKDEQISVQEKICNALGVIGSSEAIKTLSVIAESKSFLGRSSYPTEVKDAAIKALDKLKKAG